MTSFNCLVYAYRACKEAIMGFNHNRGEFFVALYSSLEFVLENENLWYVPMYMKIFNSRIEMETLPFTAYT